MADVKAEEQRGTSLAPALIKITVGAIVVEQCEIKGDVTIGTRTVVHPRAKIIAENGAIVIGEANIIEECATIINRSGSTMQIGNGNMFEVGSVFEGLSMRDNNVLEARAHVGRSINVNNGCVIGARCELTGMEILPDNTVVYGETQQRRVAAERPTPHALQLDLLAKLLPKYHHVRKANVKRTADP